jgi:hypothetical protein
MLGLSGAVDSARFRELLAGRVAVERDALRSTTRHAQPPSSSSTSTSASSSRLRSPPGCERASCAGCSRRTWTSPGASSPRGTRTRGRSPRARSSGWCASPRSSSPSTSARRAPTPGRGSSLTPTARCGTRPGSRRTFCAARSSAPGSSPATPTSAAGRAAVIPRTGATTRSTPVHAAATSSGRKATCGTSITERRYGHLLPDFMKSEVDRLRFGLDRLAPTLPGRSEEPGGDGTGDTRADSQEFAARGGGFGTPVVRTSPSTKKEAGTPSANALEIPASLLARDTGFERPCRRGALPSAAWGRSG